MELSVVIAAYNREHTVAATVASVLECGADVEVIVVDDGSTDRTAEVAQAMGPRVRVVRQPNGGPAVARNTGLSLATAPVIAFLDSDDCWNANVIPTVLQAFREHAWIDVLFCETHVGNTRDGYQTLSTTTGRGRFAEMLLTNPIGPELFRIPRNRFVAMMLDRNQVFLGSTLFRKSVIDSQGGFIPSLFGGEDYELCLRYAVTCQFAFYTRPLARYVKHGEGLSANPDRMAREFALAIRSVLHHPQLTSSERRLARAKYRQLAFEYGYLAFDRSDYREARRRFTLAIRTGGRSTKSCLYWIACQFPPSVLNRLRRLKQGAFR